MTKRVTYLSHSAFVVTLDEVILVFDYVHDPSHKLKHILDQNPDKPVIFFISHVLVNNNHFNPGTFEIAQNHRRVYVASNSLPAMYIPSNLEVQGMSKGDVVENLPGHVKVEAFGTTDKDKNRGVSFMVTAADGTKIFHAGHLNEWYMPDESTPKEAQKSLNDFKTIVNRIASEYPSIDIAFFPVDPRISVDYANGARIFASEIHVKDFFPMDIDGDIKEACNFANYLPAGTTGHCMREPGESINLAN